MGRKRGIVFDHHFFLCLTTGSKYNADLSPALACQVVCKVIAESDDKHNSNQTEATELADVNENADDVKIVGYQSLKTMANADYEVRI